MKTNIQFQKLLEKEISKHFIEKWQYNILYFSKVLKALIFQERVEKMKASVHNRRFLFELLKLKKLRHMHGDQRDQRTLLGVHSTLISR